MAIKVNAEWISVKDRLPEREDYNDRGYVIVARDDGTVDRDFQNNGRWLFTNQNNQEVTHWMPFPPAPVTA